MKYLKKYKGMLIVLVVCLLIEAISMRSYAYFAYEEEVEGGTLETGTIYVDVENTHALGVLSNMTPNASFNNDNYIGFSVEYKNETNKTLYYDIKLEYGDNVNNKLRIHDEHLNFKLVEVDSEGNELNVLISDQNYASIKDTIIYEQSVAGGTNNTTKYYKLYVRINTDTNICSTTSLNYGCDYYENIDPRWTNVYASINVGVSADFEEKTLGTKFYDTIKSGAVTDTGVDFSTTTGDGKYYMHTTGASANDLSRIYYYRGNVPNNNVVFGGICWKIVRTTDTGGIKMIYNGTYTEANKCNNTGNSTKYGDDTYFNDSATSISYKSLAAMGYSYVGHRTTKVTGEQIAPYEWVENGSTGMSAAPASGAYFGQNVNYSNGVYSLVNATTGIANGRHYTCNLTSPSTTCSKVRYYFYYTSSKYYYIELEGGDKIEDFVNSVLNGKTDSYSNVQQEVNRFYREKIEELGYDSYVEDTVWCMERNRLSQSDSWDPSGSLTVDLWTTAYKRSNENTNAIKLKCDGTLTIGSKGYTDYYVGRDETDLLSVIIIRRGKENEHSKEQIFDYLSGVFKGDITKIEKYTDTDSDPEIRKEVSEMSGIGESLVIDARLDDLQKLVIAGKIGSVDEAEDFYPSLKKYDIQEIFNSLRNNTSNQN